MSGLLIKYRLKLVLGILELMNEKLMSYFNVYMQMCNLAEKYIEFAYLLNETKSMKDFRFKAGGIEVNGAYYMSILDYNQGLQSKSEKYLRLFNEAKVSALKIQKEYFDQSRLDNTKRTVGKRLDRDTMFVLKRNEIFRSNFMNHVFDLRTFIGNELDEAYLRKLISNKERVRMYDKYEEIYRSVYGDIYNAMVMKTDK